VSPNSFRLPLAIATALAPVVLLGYLAWGTPLAPLAFAEPATSAPSEDHCTPYLEADIGNCGPVYLYIYNLSSYAFLDCDGCGVHWDSVLTDRPTPVIPLPGVLPTPGRQASGGGESLCGVDAPPVVGICPATGLPFFEVQIGCRDDC
jgi:hypothetical protein